MHVSCKMLSVVERKQLRYSPFLTQIACDHFPTFLQILDSNVTSFMISSFLMLIPVRMRTGSGQSAEMCGVTTAVKMVYLKIYTAASLILSIVGK